MIPLPRTDTGVEARAEQHSDVALDRTLIASRALLGVIARSLAPVMDTVTLPQFRVLVVLSNFGPLRMGELAPAHWGEPIQLQPLRGQNGRRRPDLAVRQPRQPPRSHHLPDGGWGARVCRGDECAPAGDFRGPETLSANDLAAVHKGFEIFARAAGEPSADETLILGI